MKGWFLYADPNSRQTLVQQGINPAAIAIGPGKIYLAGKPPIESAWRDTVVGHALKPPSAKWEAQLFFIPIIRTGVASWLVIELDLYPVFIYEFIGLGKVVAGQGIYLEARAFRRSPPGRAFDWWASPYE